MTEAQLEILKYPIGKFSFPEKVTESHIRNWIEQLVLLPEYLEEEVGDLTKIQLETPYRPEGWNIRQLVHHIADSHMNAYLRFKWALTEDTPTIKAYNEKRFAELDDSRLAPINFSLDFIKALHERWVFLLRHLKEEDFDREFIHPETEKSMSLLFCLAMYSWHGRHHLAHIQHLKKRKDWY